LLTPIAPATTLDIHVAHFYNDNLCSFLPKWSISMQQWSVYQHPWPLWWKSRLYWWQWWNWM